MADSSALVAAASALVASNAQDVTAECCRILNTLLGNLAPRPR